MFAPSSVRAQSEGAEGRGLSQIDGNLYLLGLLEHSTGAQHRVRHLGSSSHGPRGRSSVTSGKDQGPNLFLLCTKKRDVVVSLKMGASLFSLSS